MAHIETCPGCDGTGAIPCPICGGKQQKRPGFFESILSDPAPVKPIKVCQTCHGTRKLLCTLCGGVGKIRTDDSKTTR